MKINILENIRIKKLPSGSGIIKKGNHFFAIGDDSQFLFELDHNFEIISKTQLIETEINANYRIPKPLKPDFEAFEMINDNQFVIFGSGSKSPERNIFIQIDLNNKNQIEKYDITEFYNTIKALPILKNSNLNIEGVAYFNNEIYLLNRTNNVLFKFKYDELINYFKTKNSFPTPTLKQFHLPKINTISSGFTGATIIKNSSKLIFTSSVENTLNPYNDGEILGSFIGLIDIKNGINNEIIDFTQLQIENEILKIESITIDEEISDNKVKVVVISDDDNGNSNILKCILEW